MAKDDQGFMDWLVNDIANTIEIKGAVEASRDENGNVDKWKATGLTMGLGHTSDDDLATLTGFLGAEGAFDDKKLSLLTDDSYGSVSSYTSNKSDIMSEDEYKTKRKDIFFEAALLIFGILFLSILFFIAMIRLPTKADTFDKIFFIGIFAFFCLAIFGLFKYIDDRLSDLETKYTESKKKQQEAEEKAKREQEKITERLRIFDMLRNHTGSTDFDTVKNLVYEKAENIFNKGDRICDIDKPTYDANMINNLLIFIIYFSLDRCEITEISKSDAFDSTLNWCKIESDINGNMLFFEKDKCLINKIKETTSVLFSLISIAVLKSNQINEYMDFLKTMCSLMLLIQDKFCEKNIKTDFGDNAVNFVFDTAEKTLKEFKSEKNTAVHLDNT